MSTYQEHESMTATRCCICATQTMSDPNAFYNTRLKGWMCGICHSNAVARLMAYLTHKENHHA